MPTFSTALYTSQLETRANPSRLADANINSGTVEFAAIPYTLAGTEASLDKINLMLLPEGCIPMPQLSKVTCSADPGTTLNIDVGNGVTSNGYADNLVLDAGATVEFMSGSFPPWTAKTPIVADTAGHNSVIQAVLNTVTAPSAGVILYFLIAWKRNR